MILHTALAPTPARADSRNTKNNMRPLPPKADRPTRNPFIGKCLIRENFNGRARQLPGKNFRNRLTLQKKIKLYIAPSAFFCDRIFAETGKAL